MAPVTPVQIRAGLFGFELQILQSMALEDNLDKTGTGRREFIFNSLSLKDKKEKDALGLAGGVICSFGYGAIGIGTAYLLRDYTPPIHYLISIPCLILSSLCTFSVVYDLALRYKEDHSPLD